MVRSNMVQTAGNIVSITQAAHKVVHSVLKCCNLWDLATWCCKDHTGCKNGHNLCRGASKGFELAQRCFVQRVEGFFGRCNDGLSSLQVLSAFSLEQRNIILHLTHAASILKTYIAHPKCSCSQIRAVSTLQLKRSYQCLTESTDAASSSARLDSTASSTIFFSLPMDSMRV